MMLTAFVCNICVGQIVLVYSDWIRPSAWIIDRIRIRDSRPTPHRLGFRLDWSTWFGLEPGFGLVHAWIGEIRDHPFIWNIIVCQRINSRSDSIASAT